MTKTKTTTRKKLQGFVTRLSSISTIVVEVESKAVHPKYKKIIVKHKRFLVQCLDKGVLVGDRVMIEEGRKISSSKCFYFVKKI